jgi:LysR family transcriptional regulator, transcriptional activator of nhaA
MEWLNYHHLLYFYVVAREGSLVAAGKVLHVSHSTLSAQIHALEEQMEEQLFVKQGRRLVLTELGQVVFKYAEEIFSLGREMMGAVKRGGLTQPTRLDVGVVDAVPKLIVKRLLEPGMNSREPLRLVCREDSFDRLLAELATNNLDLVISDNPVPSGGKVRAFNHLLGETGSTVFATEPLARTYRRGFPRSLDGAPMLLPLEHLTLRRSLDQWFSRHGVQPRVVAEFEDSALMKVFGADGVGLFVGPTVVEREVCEQYGVQVVGTLSDVRERFYAVSVERRLKHPAVVLITDAARHRLFARESK